MQGLKQLTAQVRGEFNKKITAVTTLDLLEVVRIAFVGKQGKVTVLFKNIKDLNIEEKKDCVPLLNELKTFVENEIKQTKQRLIEEKTSALQQKQTNFDVTAYKTGLAKGHLHPYSHFFEEVENAFMSMGYDMVDGPYVENDHYNFTALNVPQDHPARDMYDTFWLNKKSLLLRTHTSPVQVHTMEKRKPPLAVFVPGYAFRHEAVDASHDTMFTQCEGLLIDKNVTLSHLFATAQELLKILFKTDKLDIRIRPGFFPFVEPGVEIDMRCPFCTSGCSVCKKTRWIEVFPGGLVHPNVLRAGGIDPEKYSGFAFGFGATRLAMLKYKINDIRLFLSGKTKFLEQF